MYKPWRIPRPFGVILVLFLFLCGAALQPGRTANETGPETSPGDNSSAPSPPPQPEFVNITIASVGDILIHNTLYYAAYDPAALIYDFSDQLKQVKPYLENADITLANLETVLAGPERGYAGYPKFNTPDTIVQALQDAGIDIITAANNHRMDQGVSGFYRTIRVIRNQGLDVIGVKAEEKEKTYILKDIKGVKIAFINFGYGYPLWDGSLDINGLILPVDMSGLIDTFDPRDPAGSLLALEKKITSAKADGAEIIVVCMHWGDEYHRIPNDLQKELASGIVSLGADVIFGGHPHVLQPAVYLASPEGRRVPVYYSQGNFISDQRLETVDDIYTEQGIIAKVTFRVQKNHSTLSSPEDTFLPSATHQTATKNSLSAGNQETGIPSSIVEVNAEAIPTWVNKKIVNSRFVYEVIPAQEALDNPDKFPLVNPADLERIRFCRDTVEQLSAGLS